MELLDFTIFAQYEIHFAEHDKTLVPEEVDLFMIVKDLYGLNELTMDFNMKYDIMLSWQDPTSQVKYRWLLPSSFYKLNCDSMIMLCWQVSAWWASWVPASDGRTSEIKHCCLLHWLSVSCILANKLDFNFSVLEDKH